MPTIYLKNQIDLELISNQLSLGNTKSKSGTTFQNSNEVTVSEPTESTTNVPSTTAEVLALDESTTA